MALPSSKSQSQLATFPVATVDKSVKSVALVSQTVVAVKSATGLAFTVIGSVTESWQPLSEVTVSMTL